jgi:hypothetical protein
MKRLATAAVLLTMASTAQAQATDCPAAVPGPILTLSPAQQGQNAARDICLRTKDLFQLLAPQLGVSMTGGNPVLGQGGTLGGPGHFTVEARAIAVLGDIPDLPNWGAPSQTAPTPQELPSKNFPLGLPAVDGAIGIFKGLPLGLTNVGGIDLLVSAVYIPTVDQDDFKVTPEQNLKFGYGARVGLLQESLLVPGLSATWMKRDLPTTTITGSTSTATSSMSFTMADAAIKTTSWRLIASKSLIMFGLAAGVGQDSYSQTATFSGSATTPLSVTPTTFGPFAIDNKMTRTNYFANASINLLLLKIVGEIGQVSGGDVTPTPFNTFSSGAADDTRMYGSVGLRFTW